jgi:hypothetical protein
MFLAWLWNAGTNVVTTATILAVVAWLLRTWIKERLSADIRTKTETKLVGVLLLRVTGPSGVGDGESSPEATGRVHQSAQNADRACSARI